MEGTYMILIASIAFLAVQPFVNCISNSTDQSALLAFKSAITHDPRNAVVSNWTENAHFCNWYGVTCSRRRQRATSLVIRHMGIQGTIPPEIGNLSFVKMINLGNNTLRGRLPYQISQLHRLRALILDYNQLEGSIPPVLYLCRSLKVLSLTFNSFTGGIPQEFSLFPSLSIISLGENQLTGLIPPGLSNISTLQSLTCEGCHFHGTIPTELERLPNLAVIDFTGNQLHSFIPPGIFNKSSMVEMEFSFNNLSGQLPPTTGLGLPNLQILLIQFNKLSGSIPSYLSNSSKLYLLALSSNAFTGPIPNSLGQLELLQTLVVSDNKLTNQVGDPEISIITALTGCRLLERLYLGRNPLNGMLPTSIGNLSTLQQFSFKESQLRGPIPKEIGLLKRLNMLILDSNQLTGSIPSTIGGLKSLQRFYLYNNKIEGSIPDEICLLDNLGIIHLSNNELSGSIPTCIGDLIHLQTLIVSSNKLSSIPSTIWNLQNLIQLNLSSNSINETLDPHLAPQKVIEQIDLSCNQFRGNIPSAIGYFQSLSSIKLRNNSFTGSIPESLGNLATLNFLDLSQNSLSGEIPKSLQNLRHLNFLNLSFNKLYGEIPSGGPFASLTALSFLGNKGLCGNQSLQVPPCKQHSSKKLGKKTILLICLILVPALLIISAFLRYITRRHKRDNVKGPDSSELLHRWDHRMISSQELQRATDNFSDANMIGSGSFGSVFKGVLSDGTIVAVKVLNLQAGGGLKSFDAECQVLRTTRHRNLVRAVSACSNPEFKAIVFRFMPNGSLDKWIHSQNCCLDLLQRINILLDVAMALEYLHHSLFEPIVHCDLKPSNVLLDADMVAQVGDFGIAKMLAQDKTTTLTKTLGTLGYIAPEYGSGGKVSTKGDIYSYGIMLLEMLTKKKPTDAMFSEELSLRQWVNSSMPQRIMEVVDHNLLQTKHGEDVGVRNALFALMEMGLECTKESPEERIEVEDVILKLNNIKLTVLPQLNNDGT